ncbi:MAG: hypothetical protein OEV73_12800, partial [Desulfobulbaceae bacterium]|nr:hypothetical protein [Desulfobulbaceae bacterium]
MEDIARKQGNGRKAVRLSCLLLCVALLLGGCSGATFQKARGKLEDMMTSTDVYILKYHVEGYMHSFEEFITRLYAKNPKYESDLAVRQRKIRHIFHGGASMDPAYDGMLSHELLTAAFAKETEGDRVYLLGLGLVKSVKEAYQLENGSLLISGLQIKPDRLQRLHLNVSQVNWRLKTYRDGSGGLLFKTNAADQDGTLNMGYEVIMTEVLTRITDDIYLRGGLVGKYVFSMSSTIFVGIAL